MVKSICKFCGIVLLASAFVLYPSCDDPYEGVDYSKLIAGEKQLREEYIELVLKDSAFATSDRMIDKREDEGWIGFILEKGLSQDSVLPGKQVGIRYNYYYVGRDSTDKPVTALRYTNYDIGSPATYRVGAWSTSDTKIFRGVDLAIRHMCLYGKSFIIMPYNLGDNNYYPVVAEIEVVYMELD